MDADVCERRRSFKGPLQTCESCRTLLSTASKICQELMKCGCSPEKGCRGQCKCVRANMLCTALCKCGVIGIAIKCEALFCVPR